MTRSVLTMGAAVMAVAGLAGCAQPHYVEAAPYAADPVCAEVMLAVPEVVAGLEYRTTTSQATASWGEEFVIVARCGVEPLGPTTDECLAVTTSIAEVDWVLREQDDAWVATSFGLTPALEVTVPTIRADEAVGDVLAALSGAAALANPNGLECR